MIQTKIIESKDVAWSLPRIVAHETEVPEQEAKLAFAFIERWGMVAAEPNGEDSAGRQKLRLSTPVEVVARAFECARLAMYEARRNGLIHDTGKLFEE